jgi:hypothetical protein
MKNIILLSLFLIISSCSSTNILDKHDCDYLETYYDTDSKYITYECEEKPEKYSCDILEKIEDDEYHCTMKITREEIRQINEMIESEEYSD